MLMVLLLVLVLVLVLEMWSLVFILVYCSRRISDYGNKHEHKNGRESDGWRSQFCVQPS
jgi:hypothetical protein